MTKTIFLAAVAAVLTVAPANAALVADFQLNNSLAYALGGPAIVNNGGSLGATGISFSKNQGLTPGEFSNTAVYSIEVQFSFASLGGYQKILDFKSRAPDIGLYTFGTSLNFYPVVTSSSIFAPN